ncbi:MAG: nitroreductase family protein [Actinobacteria bacterium]|nr:MAG: nitroreductase family protein [Actinomycetota bacterium]
MTTTTSTYTPTPLGFTRLSEEEAVRRSREFLERIAERRSVRQFSSEPVSRELIENALRAAGTAPSGANQQPWTFVVVSDPELKARIRAAAEHEEELLYTQRASDEYLEAIEPIGTDAHKPHITDAPCLIAVFEQAWSRDADGNKHKNYYVRESVGIAVGFLLLALHSAGLATLTHAPSPMGFLKDILERPENERPFLLVPVGYPAPDAEVPALEKKGLGDIAKFR